MRSAYNNAWNAALSRLGISQEELSRSLIRALRSAGLVTISNDSADTAGAKQPGDQVPSSDLLKNESSKSSALFESGSAAISKSSKTISTSIEDTKSLKCGASRSQVISKVKIKHNKRKLRKPIKKEAFQIYT
jgi:hypothetical protein